MDQNHIWKLMARKLAGEAGDSELQELQGFLEGNPEWQFSYDLVQAYWSQHPDAPLSEWEIELAVDRITRKGNLTRRRRRLRRLGRRALWTGLGALSISGTVLWALFRQTAPAPVPLPHPVAQGNRVETRMGTRSRMVLPDGTTVWLNAGSVLTYPPSFYSPNREVTLDGEAFFDVVKDPAHPFIVHASNMNIKVLGTSFNVKAYSRDKTIETTLIKGAVEISRKDAPNAPRILLRPNEKLIFHALPPTRSQETPVTGTVEVAALKPYKGPDDVIETAWIRNRLEFRGDSFEDLASKMERWYNVRISFAVDSMRQDPQYRFTGSFEKESVSEALDALKLTAKFNYKIDNNDIEILP
jgi:transmembrane sensor